MHASGPSAAIQACDGQSCARRSSQEGRAFDLPIALGLMAALGAIPADALSDCVVVGELNLDGTIAAIAGALPPQSVPTRVKRA